MPLLQIMRFGGPGSRIRTWMYRKLGSRYPAVYVTAELQSAFLVTISTLLLYTFYYDAPKSDFIRLLLIVLGLTAVGIAIGLWRIYPRLRPIKAWIEGARGPDESVEAWRAAVGLPLVVIRRDLLIPIFVVAVPAVIAAVLILDVSWLAAFPIYAGALVAIGYSGILHYFAIEAGMRPVVIDINSTLPPRRQVDPGGFPLRVKLMAALPLINVITGVVVAALTSESEGGGANLGFDVLVATSVAFTVSFELSLMLSKSLLRPIRDLERATEAIRKGDYTHHVPITTADELGDLSAAFNQMVAGLAERERIREAFGTYLDKEVAEYILSEGFSPEGTEVDVSILFCDVHDFTRFSSGADAAEVVARLNELFECVVPIVAHHGGHVDKFEGDGLIAVFGAPESFPDHADRAVRAAIEMADKVNHQGLGGGFRVGVGVNTGRVVAGSIGGAGRLNFSVIGDAVNVASRVEGATRNTGDEILITAETKRALTDGFQLDSRGPVELKGKDEPMELFAVKVEAAVAAGHVSEGDGTPGDGAGDEVSTDALPASRAIGPSD
jgi:class 3 adenylate cyclase